MKDSVFIDTNIFVYAALLNKNETTKHNMAFELIQSPLNIVISFQVLNEFYNVLLRHKISDKMIIEYCNEIVENVTISSQSITIIRLAWNLKVKYKFSLWDSLIVATALQNNCKILYTEDLQHEQIIENEIEIINPFI